MDTKGLIGLGGVLTATMVAEFNDQVTTIALSDVGGGFGYSHDVTTWLPTLFVAAQVLGMATGPTLGIIFSLRHFALFAIALSCGSTLLMPFAPSEGTLLALRAVQGLAAGLTIPLLMTTALKVLDPPIRLYGLAAYALSATFAPNVSTALAALWIDGVDDWRFVFFEAAPMCALAAVLCWYGMPQDPPQWDKLKRFDWTGAAMVLVGFGSLAIVLEQGDRLDWFASPVICVLTLAVVVTLPFFIAHQLTARQPLFKLEILARRNFAYAAFTLVTFLVVALSASTLPTDFLETVQGYKPAQAYVLTGEVALSQLILLPLTALLLDLEWLDSRWISAVGLLCILGACLAGTQINPEWTRAQFYGVELVQSVGFAFVVMPLLMMATNVVRKDEGPFASGMVNTPRAVAEAIGFWAVGLIERQRGDLHYNRIADSLGLERYRLLQASPALGAATATVTPQGVPPAPGAAAALGAEVQRQVATLTAADAFWIMAALAVVMLVVLATVPVRTYPPRIALAGA